MFGDHVGAHAPGVRDDDLRIAQFGEQHPADARRRAVDPLQFARIAELLDGQFPHETSVDFSR